MADTGAGYSINPASTGAQGLENYFDNTNSSRAGGYRAPIINIATGGSSLKPEFSADGGGINWTTIAIIGGVIVGFLAYKGKI